MLNEVNICYMIDRNEIELNEKENDGRSVFLYYSEIVGMYMAFGLSAYYVTMVTDPFMSYSEELNMPVALLRKEHILYLRQGLKKVAHKRMESYQFEMNVTVGRAGYEKWEQKIFNKHEGIY